MYSSFAADEDKLKWAFRLYDMDNNGVIDIEEMANIIETLDCIEGVKPGQLSKNVKYFLHHSQELYDMMKMEIPLLLPRQGREQKSFLMLVFKE